MLTEPPPLSSTSARSSKTAIGAKPGFSSEPYMSLPHIISSNYFSKEHNKTRKSSKILHLNCMCFATSTSSMTKNTCITPTQYTTKQWLDLLRKNLINSLILLIAPIQLIRFITTAHKKNSKRVLFNQFEQEQGLNCDVPSSEQESRIRLSSKPSSKSQKKTNIHIKFSPILLQNAQKVIHFSLNWITNLQSKKNSH